MKFSVTVNLKKEVLDPQGAVVHQTIQNMGVNTIRSVRQGKYFEIEIDENSEAEAKEKISEMCKKLLANLIIEDYFINKL